MLEIVMGMVTGYLDAFKSYEIKDPALQDAVEQFSVKMKSFAQSNSDPVTFYEKFSSSGLEEEYMALIGKVAMAELAGEQAGAVDAQAADGDESAGDGDTGAAGQTGDGSAGDAGQTGTGQAGAAGQTGGGAPQMSVADYLEQYRVPYEEVKKAGGRANGEKAYENLLAVADRTDDMLEAQLIIEEERLLWHIVKDDQLDVLKASLVKTDPVQTATTVTLETQIDATEKADSAEELHYLIERLDYNRIRLVSHATTRITLAIYIANLLYAYCNSKMNTQVTGAQGSFGEQSLRIMISSRDALRGTLGAMERNFGMTFDDLLADEEMKIWLLNPQNIEETGRTKTALNPRNYEAFREVVHEEILPDKEIVELLLREVETAIWYGM